MNGIEPLADEKDEIPHLSAWRRWQKTPTPQNMSHVLKTIQPMIDKSVARFPQYNPNVLGGEARRLAIQGIKSYDPTSGAALGTHIFNHLLPLGRRGQNMTRVVTMPRSLQTEVGRMLKTEQDFREENNREATDTELQDLLQIPASKLGHLRRHSRFEFAEGQAESLPEVSEEDPKLSMWADYVYHGLDPMGQSIMDHKMGRNGRQVLSTDEIAAKLGIHPTYVDRRSKKIAEEILKGADSHRKE